MKRRLLIASFVLAWVVGVAAYALYHYPASLVKGDDSRLDENSKTTLQAPPAPPQESLSAPPPPPSRADNSPLQTRPEPPRILLGADGEQLKQIEQYLPEGARIATYPVDATHSRAALVNADLDGDGQVETIAVYAVQPSKEAESAAPLTLSVLAHEGGGLSTRSSAQLVGGILFNVDLGKERTPLAARDVTGDGHDEIIVFSGGGASVGGQLQIFALAGQSLQEIARIGGHFFHLQSRGVGRPGNITARWKDESGFRRYEWDGRQFTQTEQSSQ